jgi:hypothetical protein
VNESAESQQQSLPAVHALSTLRKRSSKLFGTQQHANNAH